MPLLIHACLAEQDPSNALLRCLNLVRAVAGRSGYLQILIERPPALARLVSLFAKSAWLATFVTRHPIVIDELLRENASTPMPTRDQLLAEAMQEAHSLSHLELDEQMDGMRQFQQARELRVAAAELTDDLALMRVGDQLTWLAEATLAAVVTLVEGSLSKRYGKPTALVDGVTHYPEFGVVAYGKLGGIELGFGSDLDVVFLHNSVGQSQQTDGDKPIENGLYYARLAQKVVHFMTTHTPAGVLYDIDLRLRPNGQSGVLVTSVEAFSQYQMDQAWTWEHQALVRARMVFGGSRVTTRFDQIRKQVLAQTRLVAELASDVTDMRVRMQENLDSGGPGQLHLKNDSGAVADIEFMVQYLVLAYANQYVELLEYPDNVSILDVAASIELITADECEQLKQHYLTLRRLINRQALQQKPAVVDLTDALIFSCEQTKASWKRLLVAPFDS